MKVTVLIADDEPVARAGMRYMLADAEWLEVVAETGDGPATVEAIDRLRPDLVFLDIQMPGMLGTEVLRSLQHEPFTVFTTAHAQHAVTGFELGALDYLLKPFGKERLMKCLERIRAAIGEPNATPAFSRLGDVLGKGPVSRLFVRSGSAILPISIADVAWFESDGDYVAAHVGRSRYMLHLPLTRLEARLDAAHFVRVHRTTIVNLDHVVAFRRRARGQLVAELDNGSVAPVSRERARELRLVSI